MIVALRENRTVRSHALAVRFTIICLGWTLATGVAIAVKSVEPSIALRSAPIPVLQPLHTLGAVSLLLSGIVTLIPLAIRRAGTEPHPAAARAPAVVLCFFALSATAIILGLGSGLEYVTWPLYLTALPILALLAMVWTVWRAHSALATLSAEGSWLLLMGLCLTPLGLLERVLGANAASPTRALMIEWHSLDTTFAGFNTALYGVAILMSSSPERARPLRPRWLYTLSVVALLSTFGHHHYLSAQPQSLKYIAFLASMLGIISFVRHILQVRRARATRPMTLTQALLVSASLWTAFAVGSGVLLAVPHVNLIFHGTHAVVGHSMGAIIGVNVSIILAILLHAQSRDDAHAARQVRAFNMVLALLVINLVAAGFVKGIMRVSATHREYMPIVRDILTPLPALGVALSVLVLRWCALAWRSAPTSERATLHPPAPRRIPIADLAPQADALATVSHRPGNQLSSTPAQKPREHMPS